MAKAGAGLMTLAILVPVDPETDATLLGSLAGLWEQVLDDNLVPALRNAAGYARYVFGGFSLAAVFSGPALFLLCSTRAAGQHPVRKDFAAIAVGWGLATVLSVAAFGAFHLAVRHAQIPPPLTFIPQRLPAWTLALPAAYLLAHALACLWGLRGRAEVRLFRFTFVPVLTALLAWATLVSHAILAPTILPSGTALLRGAAFTGFAGCLATVTGWMMWWRKVKLRFENEECRMRGGNGS
jgi:hypothetical protein